MALFGGLLGGANGPSIGLGQGLTAEPNTFAPIYEENIRYKRQEADKLRKEQQAKQEKANEEYDSIIKSTKAHGDLLPGRAKAIETQAGTLFGDLAKWHAENPTKDIYNSPYTEDIFKLQKHVAMGNAEAKSYRENAQFAAENQDKVEFDPQFHQAANANDISGIEKISGEGGFLDSSSGLKKIEKPFNLVKDIYKDIDEHVKPNESVVKTVDPNTGISTLTENKHYQNKPLVGQLIISNPKALELTKKEYSDLSQEEQDKIQEQAKKDNPQNPNAYATYAANKYFELRGGETKKNEQSINTGVANQQNKPIVNTDETVPSPIPSSEQPKIKTDVPYGKGVGTGEKEEVKVGSFQALDQKAVHKLKDADGNIIEADGIRKLFSPDGKVIGYEGKTTVESRVKRTIKNVDGKEQIVDEVVPKFTTVVFPYNENKQVESGEKGLKSNPSKTQETSYSRKDLVAAGYSDEQIDKAVKSGKLKLK